MDRILGIKDESCIPNKRYKYNCYYMEFNVYFDDIRIDSISTNCFITSQVLNSLTYKGKTFSSLWYALHIPILRGIIPAYCYEKENVNEICIDNTAPKLFRGKKFKENEPFNLSWKVTKEVKLVKTPEYEDIKDQPIFLIHNYLKEREDI